MTNHEADLHPPGEPHPPRATRWGDAEARPGIMQGMFDIDRENAETDRNSARGGQRTTNSRWGPPDERRWPEDEQRSRWGGPTEEEDRWGGRMMEEEGDGGRWQRPTLRRAAPAGPGIGEMLQEEQEMASIPRKSQLMGQEQQQEQQYNNFPRDNPWPDNYGARYDGYGGRYGDAFFRGGDGGGEEQHSGFRGGGYMGQGGGREFGGVGDYRRYDGPGRPMDNQYGRGGFGGNSESNDFGWNPKAVKDYSAPTNSGGIAFR